MTTQHTDRELMQLALEALETGGWNKTTAAITALRERLAIEAIDALAEQPAQQEKDALAVDQIFKGVPRRKLERLLADGWRINGVSIERTEADGTSRRGAVTGGGMVLWWNQEQPAQQQEPVAWMYDCGGGGRMYAEELDGVPGWTPLYTSPPASKPWVGLTQQDIDIAFDDTQEGGGFNEFARTIEAKLKEKNNG